MDLWLAKLQTFKDENNIWKTVFKFRKIKGLYNITKTKRRFICRDKENYSFSLPRKITECTKIGNDHYEVICAFEKNISKEKLDIVKRIMISKIKEYIVDEREVIKNKYIQILNSLKEFK